MVPHVADITPVVPVADLDAAVGFFRDTRGFDIVLRARGYADAGRDGGALRLILAGGPGVDMSDATGQRGIHMDSVDPEGFFATLSPALAALSPGRVREPFDQPCAQRAFHVCYDDLQTIFGETIDRRGKP